MKRRDYIIIALFIILVAVVFALVCSKSKLKNVKIVKEKNVGITEIISKKKTTLIYVMNPDNKKCKNCSKIKKYIDSKKLNYILYNVKEQGQDNYKEFLDALKIDSKIFNYPALIYIDNGIMFANIINIDDTKIVDQFIEDYDLTKVK